MAHVCNLCILRSMVRNDPETPTFDESPEEHERLHHPDPAANAQEWDEMMETLMKRPDLFANSHGTTRDIVFPTRPQTE